MKPQTHKRAAGFTLIELMLVVSLIAIIAAIAIPQWHSAAQAANEAAAISSVRTIYTAVQTFEAADSNQNFFSDMTPLVKAGLVDTNLGSGSKSGYDFFVRHQAGSTAFLISAKPQTWGPIYKGTRRFGCDEDGIVRYGTTNLVAHFNSTNIGSAPPLE
jgi:prepilin-type N-terminal cleavage/methylation domain-containing protein